MRRDADNRGHYYRRDRSRSRSRSRSPPPHSRGGGGRDYHRDNALHERPPYHHLGGHQMELPSINIPPHQQHQQNSHLLPPQHHHNQHQGSGGGVAPSVPNLMLAAQEKINRELFVGNTPPGTSEMLLMQFLNGAMRRVSLCRPDETPIIHCRVNSKFAFVECTTIQTANLVLNLNGIPFMGSCLKVSRPSKYIGPHVPAKTWQQLTGQPIPPNVSPLTEGTPEDKINRELFVGNTTPEMTERMLIDFLGNAMQQVGLSETPGNPIVSCRLSGKFAFVELRTMDEAAKALNLNNIPFMGTHLRIGRPSKYTGPQTSHINWEDILSKYLSGDMKAGYGGAGAPPVPGQNLPAQGGGLILPGIMAKPAVTKVVELQNMLTQEDLVNDQEYNDIIDDTREECSQFGALKSVVIPRKGPGITKIFLEYLTTEDASKAIVGLKGKTFDGRKVAADYFDEDKFRMGDYSR